MDVKHSLGSSIGVATGISMSQTSSKDGKKVVAIIGDSSFLHTGINGLLDASSAGANVLVLVLDNGTTGLSGRQPHPGSQFDARGNPRQGLNIPALARAAGASTVSVVDLDRGEDISAGIEAGLNLPGVAVLIARGQCPDC
jgi:indolepyruvate ferredoxin oxidoreductase alpha subunit